jgi:hypothetical protein
MKKATKADLEAREELLRHSLRLRELAEQAQAELDRRKRAAS